MKNHTRYMAFRMNIRIDIYALWPHALADSQTMFDTRIDGIAEVDCQVAQLIGAGQCGIAQAAEQLVEFLLHSFTSTNFDFDIGDAARNFDVLDLAGNSGGVLDECS